MEMKLRNLRSIRTVDMGIVMERHLRLLLLLKLHRRARREEQRENDNYGSGNG
jgi:hypothetical protein